MAEQVAYIETNFSDGGSARWGTVSVKDTKNVVQFVRTLCRTELNENELVIIEGDTTARWPQLSDEDIDAISEFIQQQVGEADTIYA